MEVRQFDGCVESVELHECTLLNIPWKLSGELAIEDSLGLSTSKRLDHASIVNNLFTIVKTATSKPKDRPLFGSRWCGRLGKLRTKVSVSAADPSAF